MAKKTGRPIALVGSVPLESASAVFDLIGTTLGARIKRIPDGETGVRRNWILWQTDVLAKTRGLEVAAIREIEGGFKFPVFRATGEVQFGALGYAEAALTSYRDFRTAKAAGNIAPETRFQVSLPTPIAVISSFCELDSLPVAWPAYEMRLCEEISQIVSHIPSTELALQFDVAVEFWYILENAELAKALPMDRLVDSIVRVSADIPPEVELGFHLCYGDPGDEKHFVDPKDMGLMVEFTNALVNGLSHPIHWVHMPVPANRDDASYFAPLRALDLPATAELYLGLIHRSDGIEGAKRRLNAARQVRTEFGVATECGFGRRPPETIGDLLELHREIALAD
ncbi:hypothetical protein [Bradyrhizobium sp. WSM3983]|uniref:hypothetical protein n=1 Tax=Bradyrhizobium sp. WSM3983 TaxID=1038867 RepID=UPI000481EA5C|nr:hypothetical protein [Bradyrhizobium sp. WSM3983]